VTIRVRASNHLFGEVVAGRMRLSPAGRVASQCWREIPKHFARVTLDVSVVMPDHVHGIVVIGKSPDQRNARAQAGHAVGAQHAAPLHLPVRPLSPGGDSLLTRGQSLRVPPGSLGAIIRAFKSATTKRINEQQGTPGKQVWQRNYYDRVIRSDDELHRARRYIRTNPDRWSKTANSWGS